MNGRTLERSELKARRAESGLSLVEAIMATAIATIAILGLASGFGDARGLVGSYGDARVALAAAQRRMEMLSVLPATDPALALGSTHQDDLIVDGEVLAHETWTVAGVDDPADASYPGQPDIARVTVTVTLPRAGGLGPVQLSRLFALP